MKQLYLIRYAEAGVKSDYVRKEFEKALARNIKKALDVEVRIERGRLFVNAEHSPDIEDVLKRIAGIHSFSPCISIISSDLDELTGIIKEEYAGKVKGKRFRITCRRSGRHSFTSMEVQKRIGGALLDKGGIVDLHNFEINITVEIREGKSYIFTRTIKGMGGFPIGTGGKAVALFSGGIDSPAAAYMMLKRGCEVIFALHNSGGANFKNRVLRVYNCLAENYCFGYTPKIYAIDGSPALQRIDKEIPGKMKQIIFKRLLYKEAEEIARKEKAYAIVTGEVVAQKSSQTLASIKQIEKVVDIPVIRPLVCMDKHEIMALARRIGTLSMSERVPELCGLADKGAATSPKDKDFEGIPPIEEDAKELVLSAEVVEGLADIEREKLPDIKGAVIIDVRKEKAEPLEGADMVMDPLEVTKAELDKKKRYVLVCGQGVISGEAARILRNKGYDVYSITIEEYKTLRNI